MRRALASEICSRVCLQEERKGKENQPPLGLYQNPPTFFFTDPRFVLLIRDRHFVLVSLHVRQCPATPTILRHSPERLPSAYELNEVREVFITSKIWIFIKI